MTESAVELATCPECGAAGSPTGRRCWLCGHPLGAGMAAARGRPRTADWMLTATLALAAIVAALMVIGVWQEAPGLAVALAVVAAVPLIATAVASLHARAGGRPLGAGEKLVKFMLSLAIVFGAIGLVAIAATIAFFFWCLSQLAGT
jgi:hypothetical protein